jgi:hypothetical protein
MTTLTLLRAVVGRFWHRNLSHWEKKEGMGGRIRQGLTAGRHGGEIRRYRSTERGTNSSPKFSCLYATRGDDAGGVAAGLPIDLFQREALDLFSRPSSELSVSQVDDGPNLKKVLPLISPFSKIALATWRRSAISEKFFSDRTGDPLGEPD